MISAEKARGRTAELKNEEDMELLGIEYMESADILALVNQKIIEKIKSPQPSQASVVLKLWFWVDRSRHFNVLRAIDALKKVDYTVTLRTKKTKEYVPGNTCESGRWYDQETSVLSVSW